MIDDLPLLEDEVEEVALKSNRREHKHDRRKHKSDRHDNKCDHKHERRDHKHDHKCEHRESKKNYCKKCKCKKCKCKKETRPTTFNEFLPFTNATQLRTMVINVINASKRIIANDITFAEGKAEIEEVIGQYNSFQASPYMLGIYEKSYGLLVVFCGRYRLRENDAVVAFSLSEDKTLEALVMGASSVPIDNNMNDCVIPSRQDVTYIRKKPVFV